MPVHEMHDGLRLKKVIVVPPEKEYFNVENLKAHNIMERADVEKAKKQHAKLRELMRSAGADVIKFSELKGHPNSVFTMDTSLPLGDAFVQLRMGLTTRRGEDEWMSEILKNMGLEKIGEIKEPGTAEGGDLIPAYPYFFIGLSRRTNREGAEQLKRILERLGYEIRLIPVAEMHLHLGGAMTLIGEDRILACKSIPRELLRGFEVIYMDCRTFITGNVINLGEERVIVEERNAEARYKLEKIGYEVFPLNLSEFVKGSGGPSCLILAIERG